MNEELLELMKTTLESFLRSEIRVTADEPRGTVPTGASHFGGTPDCPRDFVWPVFEGEKILERDDDFRPTKIMRGRFPLAFLAQIDCRKAAPYDREGLLPKDGLLSFFYEAQTMKDGYDPKDTGSARVFWFPEGTSLVPTEPPSGFRWPDSWEGEPIPTLPIRFSACVSLPSYDDFIETEEEGRIVSAYPSGKLWTYFDEAVASLGYEEDEMGERHKLLGWPDLIGEPMGFPCEALSRGLTMTDESWRDYIPVEERTPIIRQAQRDWILLFQIGTLTDGEREWAFGDGGHLYFWIRRQDLAARRFDRVRCLMQTFCEETD